MGDNRETRDRRRSLTKKQLQSDVGLELLSLCQSVTDDGRISEEEVSLLSIWLEENKDTDFPSIKYLTQIVQCIIQDKKITPQECGELYSAIKAVLPPDLRHIASLKQKQVQQDERARKLEERERNRPIGAFDFMVAGVNYENRKNVVKKYLRYGGEQVFLFRKRDNKFSKNAIEVRLENNMQIGYVPEEFAEDLAPKLDRGIKYFAFVKKLWFSSSGVPIPIIVGNLYDPSCTRDEAIVEGKIITSDKCFHIVQSEEDIQTEEEEIQALQKINDELKLMTEETAKFREAVSSLNDEFSNTCGDEDESLTKSADHALRNYVLISIVVIIAIIIASMIW